MTDRGTGTADPGAVPQTMHELVIHRKACQGSKPMLVESGAEISYADLEATSRELAAVFVESGVRKGTRVGLIMPNGVAWARVAVALTRIGAVLVPLSTLLSGGELLAQLRIASVRFLVSVTEFRGHRYLDELRSALGGGDVLGSFVRRAELPALRRVWFADELMGFAAGDGVARMVDPLGSAVRPADPLVILFTSGSAGTPKGVIHSHHSAFGAVRSGLADRCIDEGTRLYIPMPFFWAGGFAGGLLSTLLAGATLITEAVPEPTATVQLLERERVTLFRGWPDQADSLARRSAAAGADLSALRAGSLDALLPPSRRGRPGARANLFGMTESCGPYCGYPLDTDMPESAWGSCGKPFRGTEVRIADPDSGEPVPTGMSGVIHIRGSHTLRGICGRGREEVFTVDGFYPTGDLGHLDDEGFLFYHGRSDDMFKVRGATVYPGEVEQALQGIDGVEKAYVTNLAGSDGDRVAAAVVCDTSATTAEELRARARGLISSFKVPSVWLLLDSDDAIPRGSTGKLDARRLRELFAKVDHSNA